MQVDAEAILAEGRKQLTQERFEDIMGELWLRVPSIQRRVRNGAKLGEVMEYEIRRAEGLLHNPDGRVRTRPGRKTKVVDPAWFNNKKVRRKW